MPIFAFAPTLAVRASEIRSMRWRPAAPADEFFPAQPDRLVVDLTAGVPLTVPMDEATAAGWIARWAASATPETKVVTVHIGWIEQGQSHHYPAPDGWEVVSATPLQREHAAPGHDVLLSVVLRKLI